MPSLQTTLIGGALWGCTMSVTAAANLLRDGWETNSKIAFIALLFGAGAALAFPLACWLAAYIAGRKHWEARISAALICFSLVTIGVTSALYALDYRQYYAHWHAETFSITWIYELVFTAAVSLLRFAVTGVRLYFPIGFVALTIATVWFARHPR